MTSEELTLITGGNLWDNFCDGVSDVVDAVGKAISDVVSAVGEFLEDFACGVNRYGC